MKLTRLLPSLLMRPIQKSMCQLASKWLSEALVFLVLVSFLGCSYKLGFSDRAIPGGYDHIAVPVFKNLTSEAGVEVYFTNALVNELARSQIAKVTDKSGAQATLLGQVVHIEYNVVNQTSSTNNLGTPTPTPITQVPEAISGYFLPGGTVLNTDYRILATVELKLQRNSDQKILWQSTFVGERSYSAPKIGLPQLNSADSPYNHSAHYQNIAVMAQDMMAEAHDRLTENF
jgi:hypothetical protein